MLETGSLLWGFFFGSIGAGYFLYGKNQQHLVAMLSGIALCAVPYVAPAPAWMIPLSIALMALPLVSRLDCFG